MNIKIVIFGIMLSLTITYFDQVSTRIIENNESNDFGFEDYFGVKVYRNGRTCAMNGGICVQGSDCKHKVTGPSLCPDKDIGVECCYEVELHKAPCSQLLGQCISSCPENLRQPQAIDCVGKEVCCVLV